MGKRKKGFSCYRVGRREEKEYWVLMAGQAVEVTHWV
jgi:hypothetical protein